MSFASCTKPNPSIMVVGFNAAEMEALEEPVGAGGGRFLAGPSDVLADVLVIDASDELPDEGTAALAARVPQLIVRTSVGTVDDAVNTWPFADIVVGRDPVDLHFAVATALKRAASGVSATFDVNGEGVRLQRLADEIGRIARTLVELPKGLTASNTPSHPVYESDQEAARLTAGSSPVTAAEVRGIIRLRRMRDRYFPSDLFADPAWDMLLDLAAAQIERVSVAVSSLCIAAAVPPTTALRWIKAMTERGLLHRVNDQHDARRIFIRLSDEVAKMMELYLRAARSSEGMLI